MIKRLVLTALLATPLLAFAADSPPAPKAAAAPAPATTPPPDPVKQHAKEKALRADCAKRAAADKLAGEERKKFIAQCARESAPAK